MTELKPCPLCGGEAYIHQAEDGTWGIGTYCGANKSPYHSAYVIADTEAEAVKAWNTRADDRSEAADYWRRMYEETVRERTCTNGVKPGVGVMPRLYCSNCGCYTTLNKPDNATSYSESFMDWPFYCGNCGARVEGETE